MVFWLVVEPGEAKVAQAAKDVKAQKELETALVELEAKYWASAAQQAEAAQQARETAEKELAAKTEDSPAQDDVMLKEEVGPDDVADVVAAWTGIPAGRMLEGETAKLLVHEGAERGRARDVQAVERHPVVDRHGVKVFEFVLIEGPAAAVGVGLGADTVASCCCRVQRGVLRPRRVHRHGRREH